MIRLDLSQFANEFVEFGVGNLGVIGPEVAVVVIGNEFAQFCGAGGGTFARWHA
jgi:hypothetical protein